MPLFFVVLAWGVLAEASIPALPLNPGTQGTQVLLSGGAMSIYTYTVSENNDVTFDLLTSQWGDCQLSVGRTQPICDPSLFSTINISSDACSFYYERSDYSGCCENWITIDNNDPIFAVGQRYWVEVVNGYAAQPSQCFLQVTYGGSSIAADERARAVYLGWAIGVPVILIFLFCVVIPLLVLTRCCTVCCWKYRYAARAPSATQAPTAPPVAVVVVQSASTGNYLATDGTRSHAGLNGLPPPEACQWPTAPGMRTDPGQGSEWTVDPQTYGAAA